MKVIRVALFESPARAEPIRRRLMEFGIPAEVHDELGLAKLWYVSRRRAGARLEVPATDAERARRLLREWDEESGCLSEAVHCPECRSLRVDYPQFTRKSLFTNFAMGLVAELGLIEREYYCEDCHCMWAKPRTKPRRVRAHMAPDYFLEGVGNEPLREIRTVREVFCRRPFRHSSSSSFLKKCSAGGLKGKSGGLRRWIALGGLILLLANRTCAFAAEPVVASTPLAPASGSEHPTYLRDVLPILMGKCARCHNDQSQVMRNWLDYRTARAGRWEIKRRIWDSWKGSYFKQPMPTVNSPEFEAMTDEERTIIRNWVESGAVCGVPPATSNGQSTAERIAAGKRLFTTICAACHQPTGQGIPGRFPPLAGSDFLNADKHRAIQIVVHGLQGDLTVNGQKFNNAMPRFPLNDQDIASALTYVYNSFGNSGKDVTPEEVSSVRAEKDELNLNRANQSAKIPEEKSPYE